MTLWCHQTWLNLRNPPTNCRFGHGKHIYKLGFSVAMFDSLRIIDIIFAKKGTKGAKAAMG